MNNLTAGLQRTTYIAGSLLRVAAVPLVDSALTKAVHLLTTVDAFSNVRTILIVQSGRG